MLTFSVLTEAFYLIGDKYVMNKYLKLVFSGVLQYYADTKSIALRQTYNTSVAPTKSAVIGLISSAFGYERGSDKITKLMNSLIIKYTLTKPSTIFEDFQTIKPLKSQKNYMNKFYIKNQFTTVGGYRRNGQLIKNVQYLQDSEFIVYISGNEELLKNIYNALRNPKYALYFGKRCCIPNKPIVTDFELFNEEDLENVYDCA